VFVYGRNPVREAIRGPRTVRGVWGTRTALREPWLEGLGIPTFEAPPEEIERLARSRDHQGVCADVSEFRYADAGELVGVRDALLVGLDQVQDPQNLGAIARTAECAGATGLVIPERRAVEVTAAVCKSSAGAVEHLPVARVRNLADFLGEAKAAGMWCYGASADGSVGFTEVDWAGPVVLVLGSEGRGLRPRVAGACDALVSIPLRGRIESLSVSAAAAVLLYAAVGGRG
jgi:23S rRNA (guanosine2251-2'-O)-methyltransferase